MATSKIKKRTIAISLAGLVTVATFVAAFTGQLTAIASNLKQIFVSTDTLPTESSTPSPAPKPEPPFDHRTTINAFGGWQHRGDTNMGTNFNDPVTAKTETKVRWTADRVEIDISFECAESGGDGTAYFGTRTFPVYTAPQDKKIVAITGQGPLERRFENLTRGKQQELITYNTSATYWDSLRYRIDTSEFDDSPHVGVGGEFIVSIQLAPK